MTSPEATPRRRAPSSGRAPGKASEAGFTLLEVMCAFAILAGITGILTVIGFRGIERGTRALHLRELREAADTVFRKILYEEHNFNDGDGKTLDISYAEWAGLKGAERDRWRVYRWELRKERKTAAGSPDRQKGEESLFEGREQEEDRAGRTSSDTTTDEEEQTAGQALWRITVRFFHTDEPDPEPLLVLRTYLPVREDAKTAGTTSGGGGR